MESKCLTWEGLRLPQLLEPEETGPLARLVGLPLAASLLLHAGLMAWFVTNKLGHNGDLPTSQVLEVTLLPGTEVQEGTPRRTKVPEQALSGSLTTNSEPTPDLRSDDVTPSPVHRHVDTIVPADPPALLLREEAPAGQSSPNVNPLPHGRDSPEIDRQVLQYTTNVIPLPQGRDTPEVEVDRLVLQESITSYVADRRGELTEAWVETCDATRHVLQRDVPHLCSTDAFKHMNQESRQAVAEAFRSDVTGYVENAQESRKLMAHMNYLAPMLEDDGRLGELARAQHLLATYNWRSLNLPPKQGLSLFAFSLGSPKLVFISGLVTVDLREGVILGLEKPPAPKLRTFEFSGSARHQE